MATNNKTIEEGITEQEIADAIEADGRYLEYKQTWQYKAKIQFYYPLYRLWRDITDIPDAIKAFWQRGRRGWADSDAWDLDNHLTLVIPAMLRHMIDTTKGGGNSYPGDDLDKNTNSHKNWHKTVKLMAEGFEASLEQDELVMKRHKYPEYRKRWDKLEEKRIAGMTLFVKYYNHLWD